MRAAARLMSAEEAVSLIASGSTVAVGGFVGAGHPELLTAALERRFKAEHLPRDLTLFYCAGQGDRGERGLNHLAHAGLLKCVIGGHWNLAPKMGQLALANEIEAYNLPQGVMCCLLREIAAKRGGLLTRVGLNTFVDPIHGAGCMNERSKAQWVQRVELDDGTWLRYKPVPIHVALIRASSADARGNLGLEHEAMVGDVLPMAQAAKNHGGLVIVQVERLVDEISDPKQVRVPGILVDAVVLADSAHHPQTFAEAFNPDYIRSGAGSVPQLPPMAENERKAIGRRALAEIRPGDIVNLGIGLPEAVAAVAAETNRLREFTLTVESGPTGGVPASGLSFGCSALPEAIIDQPAQFDFYDGGGLDIAVLGAVEVDAQGSVNVASFAGRFAGVGGFINISQSAKRLVFCLNFQAKGQAKFVPQVQLICFHGPSALRRGQQVLYVTERAVFELTSEGLMLVELRAGMDLQRDVLEAMQFRPLISPHLQTSP
jgi:propionate CoA-transferase